jgi:general secretion pathway protein G
MKKNKKQAMTLLEVMIVIFIIGIISSVIGYNMKGSLNKAKAFKTTEGIKKILEIFELEIAQGSASLQDVVNSPEAVLDSSGLVSSGKEMMKDGWGQPYEIKLSASGKIQLKSKAYEAFLKKQKKKAPAEIATLEDDEED